MVITEYKTYTLELSECEFMALGRILGELISCDDRINDLLDLEIIEIAQNFYEEDFQPYGA